jgi:Fe-S cluster assembly protein SufD
MVHVAPEGQHTDSAQICRSLLLGAKASVDMRPELEIFADQVQCAHGATCGELDQTALHYLRSRGLDVLTARRLLLESFALPLLKDWPDDLQQAVQPALMQRMHELGEALAQEVAA